jgi:hypothetical protein
MGAPCQVVATWSPQVAWRPDPTRGGMPVPGLDGRVYLFGQRLDIPVAADGVMVIDLIDETPALAGGPPVMLEEWRFDPETLKLLLRRDAVGWGYNLFLPWSTYRPDVAKVQLRVRFEPLHGGMAVYSQGSPLALTRENSADPFLAQGKSQTSGPALARQNAPMSAAPITQTSARPPMQPITISGR